MNTITQRKHGQGSPFSEWLRDSKNHDMNPRADYLRVYDIDWIVWKKEDNDFGHGPFMLVEEKCYDKRMEPDQALMYKMLDTALKFNPYYKGFHVLTFERTTPTDGAIHLNESYITVPDLIQFWKFGKPEVWYESWFDILKVKNIHWRQLTTKREN